MDRTKPLWSLHVIHGIPGHTVLFQQGHHAMVDGATGVAISLIMLDLEPDAAPPDPPETPWEPEPLPSQLQLIQDAIRDNVESARESASALGAVRSNSELLRTGARAMMRFVNEPAILAPWNRGTVGPKRRLAWTQHSFAEFREIRRIFGGTINDVVLAVVSEGAARYLAAHDDMVEEQKFRIMCPVNVRREDEEGELGNKVSGIFPMLPARPMEIVERLETVAAEIATIKANQEAQGLQMMTDTMPEAPPVAMAATRLVGTPFDPSALLSRIPVPPVQSGGSRAPFFGFNFTCTNVPGVQVPQYIAGHKVLKLVSPLMLGGTLGCGMTALSYNKDLYMNFVSEPRLMEDPDVMRDFVDEAFNELLAEARSRTAAAAG
jgi:WS/DGAT/MGAT family acyltransferase